MMGKMWGIFVDPRKWFMDRFSRRLTAHGKRLIVRPRCYHDPQCHGVEHVLVKALLPGSVLGQVDFEFREFRDDGGCYLLLASVAMTADELLDRAGGIADKGQTLASCKGSDFVEQ